ncbi:hypothetical protein, partial [Komagataeibacter europaeus]
NTYTGVTTVASGAGLTVSNGGQLNGTDSIQNDGTMVLDNGSVTMTKTSGTSGGVGVIASGLNAGSDASLMLKDGSS